MRERVGRNERTGRASHDKGDEWKGWKEERMSSRGMRINGGEAGE